MLDKQLLKQTIEESLEGTDLFLVDLKVTGDNVVTVEVDSAKGVDIDACIELTRKIHEAFDTEVEDYELEVGSAGLTSPFKVVQQYIKNIGNPVEVLTSDGRKLHGILVEVSPTENTFTMEVPTKVKVEGKKRPETVNVAEKFEIGSCKKVCYDIDAALKDLK